MPVCKHGTAKLGIVAQGVQPVPCQSPAIGEQEDGAA